MASSGAPVVTITGLVRGITDIAVPMVVDKNTGEITSPARQIRQITVDTGMDATAPDFGEGGFAVIVAKATEADRVASLAAVQKNAVITCRARAYVNLITVREPRRDERGERIRGTGSYRNEVQFSLTAPLTVVKNPPGPAPQKP